MKQSFSFGNIVPLIPALHLDETIAFYVKELGFTKIFQDEDSGYTGLCRDDVELHLYKTEDQALSKQLAEWTVIRLQTSKIEKLYRILKDKDFLHPNANKIELKEYGLKEFSIVDPSGVLITFYENPRHFGNITAVDF
ncbi:VOC family protein [Falsibacillus albus]|uniref:VOC family protein n=1 Tax=Falsibacillus albus TaxID=2478915 RepID=A0A3L7JR50_9BACI|nr:VOC family protein [Falsibacillus albus]RLQ93307.1 VOC family protein [Falsibacillus albus]